MGSQIFALEKNCGKNFEAMRKSQKFTLALMDVAYGNDCSRCVMD